MQTTPFKIVLVGDSGSGKSALVSRLTRKSDVFTRVAWHASSFKWEPTNGVYNVVYDMVMDKHTIKLDIWELGGREKYRDMAKHLLSDASGVLVVYDISNEATFQSVAGWLKECIRCAGCKTVVKLVGNKNDLHDQCAVPSRKVEQFAAAHGLCFTETSALSGNNVQSTFQSMMKEMLTAMHSNTATGLFSTCSFISSKMIKDDQLEHLLQDLPCDGTQEQEQQQVQPQQPFHIVLIDIKKAAYSPCEIYCVEMPLDDADLKYVALSYRWGELHETSIDTKVGYTAKVTSFDVDDFHLLCGMILRDGDMNGVDYVWVDAICVDQANYERRKATILHMSLIYERATWILAVPDLHLAHLKNTSGVHAEVISKSFLYNSDIYHLIHGHADDLARIEEKHLDYFNVPADPALRHLLRTSTDHLSNGLMTQREFHFCYNAEQSLDHIYETYQAAQAAAADDDDQAPPRHHEARWHHTFGMARPHPCYQEDCPLDLLETDLPEWRQRLLQFTPPSWKHALQERSHSIRRSINFMADLIKDWSSRVWVISEYNIAKKNNRMKFWFIQLESAECLDDPHFRFFKFDFDDLDFATSIQAALPKTPNFRRPLNDPVYLTFYQTMLTQLKYQNFFEMMLKSKASKNEDRFHAIFPLTEYKSVMTSKAMVDSWKIDTLTSVKLKLFQVMTTIDKLNFLFFSANRQNKQDITVGQVLPTFATSNLDWESPMEHLALGDDSQCNFDLDGTACLTLYQPPAALPYLYLKPKEYFVDVWHILKSWGHQSDTYTRKHQQWQRAVPAEDCFDKNVIVCIPSFTRMAIVKDDSVPWNEHVIYLLGNFKTNTWILEPERHHPLDAPSFQHWTHQICDDNSPGFNIY